MTTPDNGKLEKVRKLLVKAEAEGCTPEEAKALTAKAAELMAQHGIDRALLAATKPETDKPSDRKIDIDNPWGKVKSSLLHGLSRAMRCDAVTIPTAGSKVRVHVFGFQSDLERLDILYTSLLLQMVSALQNDPMVLRDAWMYHGRQLMAFRRSYLLGFIGAVIKRVKAAEARATEQAEDTTAPGTALVLADRSLIVKNQVKQVYPDLRKVHVTYTGSAYGHGRARGQRANIGGTSISHNRKELN